jgi:hypothetical protein
MLNHALHAAAGIVMCVVAVELQEALGGSPPPWAIIVGL